MIGLRHIVPLVLGIGALGAMMATTPGFDDVFKPLRTTIRQGDLGQARLFGARLNDWQTTKRLSFEHYGSTVVRDTQAVFLVVDIDIEQVHESVQLSASWLGSSGRRYIQTTRASDAPGTLDTRHFHPGIVDHARAVFELPQDEIAGGVLLLARKGLNTLDSELALTPPPGAPSRHTDLLELTP